jgi:hypothetical protein
MSTMFKNKQNSFNDKSLNTNYITGNSFNDISLNTNCITENNKIQSNSERNEYNNIIFYTSSSKE